MPPLGGGAVKYPGQEKNEVKLEGQDKSVKVNGEGQEKI